MSFRPRAPIGKDTRPQGRYNVQGEAAYMDGYADNDFGTISINGTQYQIESYGFVCGQFACYVLSQFSCLLSPSPYCGVCATCWHPQGDSYVPDWISCGESVDDFGLLVRFKPAWRAHCLGLLGYSPVS